MLSNIEFSAMQHVPLTLPKDIEEMAMFTINMGAWIDDNTKQPAFPALFGKNLWKVQGLTRIERQRRLLAEYKTQLEKDAAIAEAKRQALLSLYISRGYAFEPEPQNEKESDNENSMVGRIS